MRQSTTGRNGSSFFLFFWGGMEGDAGGQERAGIVTYSNGNNF